MHWISAVGPLVAAALGVFGIIYRRYRKAGSREVGPYRKYLIATMRLRIAAITKPLIVRQLNLRRYAELSLSAQSSRMIIPSLLRVSLDIDRSYVPLSLSRTDSDVATIEASQLAVAGQPFLVFGEPGSGKTTLTRKLYRDICKQARLAPRNTPLPIRLDLRNIAWSDLALYKLDDDKREIFLYDAIKAEVVKTSGVPNDSFFIEAIASGGPGITAILDGLDEVPAISLVDALEAIVSLIGLLYRRSLSRHTVIVTARSQMATFLPDRFIEQFEGIVRLKPFTLADVYLFLRKWPFGGDNSRDAERIFENLQQSQSLQEMCTNPLILSMYVARDQQYRTDEGGRSPRLAESRADFYKQVVDELVVFRRAEQVGIQAVPIQMRRRRFQLLGALALDHIRDPTQALNSFSWATAIRFTKQIFHCKTDDAAAEVLRQISVDTGLVTEERREESLRFLHLTLCEYLAAVELRERPNDDIRRIVYRLDGEETITGRAHVTGRLEETLRFAIVHAGRAQREELLNSLTAEHVAPLVLRIYGETKEFLSSHYGETLKRQAALLRREPDYRDGDEYRLDLVLASLRMAASDYPDEIDGRFPSVFSMFAQLAAANPDNVSFLLEMLLLHDPELAIREAEALGIAGSVLSPTRLAGILTSPALVLVAIDRFRSSGSGARSSGWVIGLAEAALKHTLVAQMLHVRESFGPPKRGASPNFAWDSIGPAAGTLYGEILAASLAAVGSFEVGKLQGLHGLALLTLAHAHQSKLVGTPKAREKAGLPHLIDDVKRLLLNILSTADGRLPGSRDAVSSNGQSTFLTCLRYGVQVWSSEMARTPSGTVAAVTLDGRRRLVRSWVMLAKSRPVRVVGNLDELSQIFLLRTLELPRPEPDATIHIVSTLKLWQMRALRRRMDAELKASSLDSAEMRALTRLSGEIADAAERVGSRSQRNGESSK